MKLDSAEIKSNLAGTVLLSCKVELEVDTT